MRLVFELPPQYVARVPIAHPEHPQIAELGLQWYAVPAVSCLELSVGGLTYTACPFNGWYAVTEIVRNITEEGRYDQCPAIASKLGLDTRTDANMWRDQCIVVATQAIMHSFRAAGYGMVDHHTLMKNFWGWYNKEKERRGYSPGNWKWIIPPVSPTASRCYLELNHMTEYTIKPGYWYAPMWRKYLARLKQHRAALLDGAQQGANPASAAPRAPPPAAGWQKARLALKLVGSAAAAQDRVFVAYASVTGTTAKYAEAVARVLNGPFAVSLNNMEEFEPDSWSERISTSRFMLLMTSTYGPGAPPSTANKFVAWLQKGIAAGGESKEVLSKKPFAVLGFGSSSYPRFCAAADSLNSLVVAAGANPVSAVVKADALSHEEVTVWAWVRELMANLRAKSLVGASAVEKALERVPVLSDGKPKPFVPMYTLIDVGKVEGLRAASDRFRQEATVVEVKELLGEVKEDVATKQVIFDVSGLPGGSISYLAGDELEVWGENSPEVVEAVAAALGLTGDRLDGMFLLQQVANEDGDEADALGSGLATAPFPLPNTYRTVLARYAALCDRPSYEAIRAMASYAPEEIRLRELSESYTSYEDWVTSTGIRWADMWKEFPVLAGRVPPEVFFQLVPVIKSRHYSISSSSAQHPGQLHLTISRLAYTLPSGERRAGFCSAFLASRKPGDRVGVKVLPTPGFRMPLDPTAPVIMVAAGTGIAPFKSFWEERLARVEVAKATRQPARSSSRHSLHQRLGPSVLVFGCRNSVEDYLYRDTVEDAMAQGALTRVLTAFSREPGTPKVYVQDVVGANGELLGPLLRDKRCHVYVCGGSAMAQEVAVAFRKVMGAEGFRALVEESRYHEDVFGMLIPEALKAQQAAAAKGAISLLGSATPEQITELLDKGALALDSVDHNGSTLLHVAARAGNLPLARTLLDRGCPLNVLDATGCTPLQVAKLTGQSELSGLLESRGGKLVSLLVSSFYPLHAAVMEGDLEGLKEAIAAGANLAATDYFGLTPLHVACAVAGADVIKALIDAGAPLGAPTRKGLLPLQLALALARPQAVQLLQDACAPLVQKAIVSAGTEAGTSVAWDPNSANELGMSLEEMEQLQGSWAFLSKGAFPGEVKEQLESFSVDFFMALFEQSPGLINLFPFKDVNGKPIIEQLKVHGLKVFQTIGAVIDMCNNYSVLLRVTTDLVARHIKYGVLAAHYDVLFQVLVGILTNVLGSQFSGTLAAGWVKLAGFILRVVKDVYSNDTQQQGQQEGAKEQAPAGPQAPAAAN
ncbi:hypothetical protein GPECTOR_12g483 [Gonium pectorale]|uniref:Uncharacterized protein n=1 Tax=Gonium pectorale TaxID=33097 RepID=A0A150GQ95_GONPE|nr:hypothetical protein GPECTOR_12g483 [Gonium pectorale]|eukprot:KXZ51520.1 hypothetical protein GPECTOR_12g483 [Gonium pectorale]